MYHVFRTKVGQEMEVNLKNYIQIRKQSCSWFLPLQIQDITLNNKVTHFLSTLAPKLHLNKIKNIVFT